MTLWDMVLPIEPAWAPMRADLEALSPYGLDVLYPGVKMDREAAKEAVAHCRSIHARVRASLGLAP